MPAVRTLATGTHGRYLIDTAADDAPWLVGFHGYAENAELMFERLRAVAGSLGWNLVAVEALHRFYRGRTQDVIASWMTSQERELTIADNLAYVNAVMQTVRGERRTPLVYAGFSQGAAMAFRAASLGVDPAAAVIVIGGDVPPELTAPQLARTPAVLLGRNADDEWYSAVKADRDRERLTAAGVAVTFAPVAGGHDWNPPFSERAGAFLHALR